MDYDSERLIVLHRHIQKMIDDLSASATKMQLTGYEWDSERSISYNEDGEYEVDTDTLLNMDAVIYMCVN